MRLLCLALILICVSCVADSRQQGEAETVESGTFLGDAFSGDSAFVYLEKQVDFGPRVPGSQSHTATATWLKETLRRHGAEVTTQEFSYTDARERTWPLTNILGTFGTGGQPLLLVAHWDSRPWADQDPEPRNHEVPVTGANDGASGVAVLLEIARHLEDAHLKRPVHLLLVDGEDLGSPQNPESFCQGSRYFAAHLPAQYHGAIVLDMVGDKDLLIPIEYHSLRFAPTLVDWVWARGEQVSPGTFSRRVQGAIMDDHVPLQEAGIPAIDLIDFDYWAWHTTGDDLSQVSPVSLSQVGTVILSLVLNP